MLQTLPHHHTATLILADKFLERAAGIRYDSTLPPLHYGACLAYQHLEVVMLQTLPHHHTATLILAEKFLERTAGIWYDSTLPPLHYGACRSYQL